MLMHDERADLRFIISCIEIILQFNRLSYVHGSSDEPNQGNISRSDRHSVTINMIHIAHEIHHDTECLLQGSRALFELHVHSKKVTQPSGSCCSASYIYFNLCFYNTKT